MSGRSAIFALVLGIWAASGPALGLDMTFPGPAEKTASRIEDRSSFRLPVGPFANGSLPTELIEGSFAQVAYRVTLVAPSTLDLMQALRQQAIAAGYAVGFECETAACGGFDFRFGIDVLPEPDMHVDLGDFRYMAARRGSDVLALLVSRTGTTGFVQVTTVGGSVATKSGASVPQTPATKAMVAPKLGAAGSDLIGGLEKGAALALDDLVFPSGSSSLATGDYASLTTLAAWLKSDPARKVVLVGHTDASGGLDGNLRLSRLRAESVRQALLYGHKIAPEQVASDGVGYLAPRASNLTEEGRRNNRRVEVMVTSTELLKP